MLDLKNIFHCLGWKTEAPYQTRYYTGKWNKLKFKEHCYIGGFNDFNDVCRTLHLGY